MSTDNKCTDYFYNGSSLGAIHKSEIFFNIGFTKMRNHICVNRVAVYKVDNRRRKLIFNRIEDK